MAWNYRHQTDQLEVNDVFNTAYNNGFYETQEPWTSPAHMQDMGRYYSNQYRVLPPVSGNIDTENKEGAREFLTGELMSGNPLIVDVTTPLGNKDNPTHFVVVTGVNEQNGEWYIIYNDPIPGTAGEKIVEWDKLWLSWRGNKDEGGQGWWMVVK